MNASCNRFQAGARLAHRRQRLAHVPAAAWIMQRFFDHILAINTAASDASRAEERQVGVCGRVE